VAVARRAKPMPSCETAELEFPWARRVRGVGSSRTLQDHAESRCLHCGATIWLYSTENGNRVALDDAPGPYLIDGTKAYRSRGSAGFRGHWDHCLHTASYDARIDVLESEFLWV
jgi:hypothetical protein